MFFRRYYGFLGSEIPLSRLEKYKIQHWKIQDFGIHLLTQQLFLNFYLQY